MLSNLVNLGLKLPDLLYLNHFDLFCSVSILNLSAFTLIWSFTDLIYRSLCVLDFDMEPCLCSGRGAVPPPEQSEQYVVPPPISRWQEAVLG